MLTLYKNIKKLREELGMSQDELAESRSSIAKIEKGLVDLQQSKIISFANALGVTPSQLMGWDDSSYKNQTTTIAAHKDGENFTPDELAKIEEYKKLLLAARPKD